MRVTLSVAVVIIACWAVEVRAEEVPADAPLAQAQKDLNEAARLDKEAKYAEAVTFAEQARRLREKARGPNHPEVAECLQVLGDLHRTQGHYQQGESLLQRALEIRETTLGKGDLTVAQTLNSLGTLYFEQALFDRAEPLYQRALRIRQAVLGKDHLDVAQSLNSLANLHRDKGFYDRAEPLYQRALQIREAALGKSHPDVAKSLHNLANLYSDEGLYTLAEPLFQRALQIWEATVGANHPYLANSLSSLALLYDRQGLHDRTEPLHLRALRIYESALGKNHLRVSQELTNLANLYYEQGAYDRAEPLYQRAIQVAEMAVGKDHPAVAQALNNLANTYIDQGFYGRSDPLYRRALEIYEAAQGKNHGEIALVLANWAIRYQFEGFYDQAEPLLERALRIREMDLGPHHPTVARALGQLAALYIDRGFYDRAAPLLERALQIQEVALGKNHPFVAETLRNIAQTHLAQGRPTVALPLLERSFAVSERRLRGEAIALSEPRLAGLLNLLQAEYKTHYNLLREHLSDPAVRRVALTTALLRKARSATEIADTSRAIYRHLGPDDRESYQRLRAFRTQYSSLSLAGPDKLSPAAFQARLQGLAAQADALEAALAEHSARLRAQQQLLPNPNDVIARVVAALPLEAALVEFISYSASPVVHPPNTPPAQVPSTPSYLALILLPSGDLHAADLGPAEAIDDAVQRLRIGLSSPDADYLRAAQELHRRVIQPLISLLGTQRRLFIAPDSQLHLVPFAALHDGTHYLADTFDISYLTSGKDLLRRPEPATPSRSVVVFANPDFGTIASIPPAQRGDGTDPPATSTLERSPSLDRFFGDTSAGLADQRWDPLPGTGKEAEVIHRLLPEARLFLGPAATKQSLLALTTPRILHVATHGFFIGADTAPPGTRGKVSMGTPDNGGAALLPQDPLLRAGLVLSPASAEGPPASDTALSRAQNTLVTALELAGMDLWGTELVVLSACDTGRGEIRRGQGVYGLRRALTVAGAETLVTSLWRVKDATTHELMKTFYERLKAGRGRADALGEAMRQMRARHPHPYYWAPFILVGSDAPLRGFQAARHTP
ncbi:MAG TPA: tetratricopeptide repeat protein [Polyangia bacterium]|nr:tetratricopeptide repeat protein [Polyangia bacterium]